MQTLNWKERAAAFLVFILGIILLLLLIVDITSSRSSSYAVRNDSILINKSDLFTKIRAFINILAAIGGGWLLLKRNTLGWSCSVAVLAFLALLSGGMMVELGIKGIFDFSFMFLGFVVLLLLLALAALLTKSARRKTDAGTGAWVIAAVLLAGLGALNFFLQ
ncbi:MAG: hypothetical protein P0Y53_18185 [Candidatus Pseudobacter hemicellulosilyticus]|uniref:Uncharacterized protein n=1 Tax=Candidatus Pseudobacter hemicellulosilyticus TaxID=3121375 RepID=A0AAJ5WPJ7_9BACT|nr:MAG: hypothetical protein P0Y53_18185 [Pseudobacter sp.]